jgi:hypothetical protein
VYYGHDEWLMWAQVVCKRCVIFYGSVADVRSAQEKYGSCNIDKSTPFYVDLSKLLVTYCNVVYYSCGIREGRNISHHGSNSS